MAESVIGQVMKESRQQAQMTVAQLAELVPADDRTIFRYEATGRIRPDVLARLVQIFRSENLRESYCRECPVRNAKITYKYKKEQPHRPGWSQIKKLLLK